MKPTVKEAVETLTEAIRNDESFYISYQANIAMAFKDAFNLDGFDMIPTKEDRNSYLNRIANKAAKNFLDMWIAESHKGTTPTVIDEVRNESSRSPAEILERLFAEIQGREDIYPTIILEVNTYLINRLAKIAEQARETSDVAGKRFAEAVEATRYKEGPLRQSPTPKNHY